MKTSAPFPLRITLAVTALTSASPALAGEEAAAPPAPVAASASFETTDAALFTLAARAETPLRQPGGEQTGEQAPVPAQGPADAAAGASLVQAGKTGAPGAGGGFALPKIVFDDTWATVGIGAGLVPSYAGSDDYIFFPLPLLAGRVGGVGISPNGPGFALDLFSPAPAIGANKARFFGGPAFRIRNDRAQQIEDAVVEQAEDLDWAVELGAQAGVSFPGVFNPLDTLTLTAQVRWDVAGAHDGMLIEPTIGYQRPFGPGIRFQTSLGAQFVDDSFADYYFTLTPAQSLATGLPLFNADGGLNSVSSTTTVAFDLDGNGLNGGFSVFTVLGYTRLIGDAKDTPFTSIRGDANNFIGGVGVGYTF